ncbi:hypothetical protein Q5P01_020732 [Channa striata]|uniref:Uncharacterized protein n=1 Tax=Channa striata TaxID=64152 RepID=A0AA88LY44_CHASR|nr:hypothetical protein Q5P01_020732 [Channa striata]
MEVQAGGQGPWPCWPFRPFCSWDSSPGCDPLLLELPPRVAGLGWLSLLIHHPSGKPSLSVSHRHPPTTPTASPLHGPATDILPRPGSRLGPGDKWTHGVNLTGNQPLELRPDRNGRGLTAAEY